mmetsp:Transcript_17989/g.60257  ORF Transcript_17989/g.60257 Transcript_17989/m.60257 type:complete len:295 (-) Transcript_17989:347-1231(-)
MAALLVAEERVRRTVARPGALRGQARPRGVASGRTGRGLGIGLLLHVRVSAARLLWHRLLRHDALPGSALRPGRSHHVRHVLPNAVAEGLQVVPGTQHDLVYGGPWHPRAAVGQMGGVLHEQRRSSHDDQEHEPQQKRSDRRRAAGHARRRRRTVPLRGFGPGRLVGAASRVLAAGGLRLAAARGRPSDANNKWESAGCLQSGHGPRKPGEQVRLLLGGLLGWARAGGARALADLSLRGAGEVCQGDTVAPLLHVKGRLGRVPWDRYGERWRRERRCGHGRARRRGARNLSRNR